MADTTGAGRVRMIDSSCWSMVSELIPSGSEPCCDVDLALGCSSSSNDDDVVHQPTDGSRVVRCRAHLWHEVREAWHM